MVSFWLMSTKKTKKNKNKKTFIIDYTNFSSFIALEHKFGLVYILLDCCFCLVFDMSKFYFEIEKLKEILDLINILKLL